MLMMEMVVVKMVVTVMVMVVGPSTSNDCHTLSSL